MSESKTGPHDRNALSGQQREPTEPLAELIDRARREIRRHRLQRAILRAEAKLEEEEREKEERELR